MEIINNILDVSSSPNSLVILNSEKYTQVALIHSFIHHSFILSSFTLLFIFPSFLLTIKSENLTFKKYLKSEILNLEFSKC